MAITLSDFVSINLNQDIFMLRITQTSLLKFFFEKLTPWLFLVLLVFLRFIPIKLFWFSSFIDGLIFASVGYLSLFRPKDLPPLFCFALGFFYDLMGGEVLGIMAFLLTAMRFLAALKHIRYIKAPFGEIWQFYVLLIAVIQLLQILWVYTMTTKLGRWNALGLHYMLMALAFPLCFWSIQKYDQWYKARFA